jgi:hypothetical protein
MKMEKQKSKREQRVEALRGVLVSVDARHARTLAAYQAATAGLSTAEAEKDLLATSLRKQLGALETSHGRKIRQIERLCAQATGSDLPTWREHVMAAVDGGWTTVVDEKRGAVVASCDGDNEYAIISKARGKRAFVRVPNTIEVLEAMSRAVRDIVKAAGERKHAKATAPRDAKIHQKPTKKTA